MSEEQQELSINWDVCCPDESAKAEPYYALMFVDENGKTDGNLWGMDGNLMLFDNLLVAKQLQKTINNNAISVRGVTKEHLEELKKLEDSGSAHLVVILGITVKGKIEALPLAEHSAARTSVGTPPPIPSKK